MLKMKFPKMPKMPKIPTKILTAMGSYRNNSGGNTNNVNNNNGNNNNMKILLSIIFEKNAKHEKINTPLISVKKVFF